MEEASERISTIGQFFQFFWKEKMWWLIPFIVVLLLIGFLVIFAQSTPLAPLLYSTI